MKICGFIVRELLRLNRTIPIYSYHAQKKKSTIDAEKMQPTYNIKKDFNDTIPLDTRMNTQRDKKPTHAGTSHVVAMESKRDMLKTSLQELRID